MNKEEILKNINILIDSQKFKKDKFILIKYFEEILEEKYYSVFDECNDNIKIISSEDFERIKKSLESEIIEMPKGLTREEKRKFILDQANNK